MPGFYVTGQRDFERAAKLLREQGNGGNRKELLKAIQSTTKPFRKGIQGSARATLPKAGGLNELVAKSPVSAVTKTSGRNVGVNLTARGSKGKRRHLRDMEEGRLDHPLFPKKGTPRKEWTWIHDQPIEPGWWSKPIKAFAPTVRKELIKAMEKVVRNAAGKH